MPISKTQSIIAVTIVNCFAIFFACVYAIPLFFYQEKPVPKAAPVIIAPPPPDPFSEISLHAEAAYVVDTATGKVLFAKNEEAQLPLASVTKVMTALVASSFPPEMAVQVTESDLASGNGGLSLGERWNLKNLLDYTLVVSSNSGASAIAGAAGAVMVNREGDASARNEDVFVRKMNETAKRLGMAQTYYLNPSGLDEDEKLSGAYGSAKDMSILFNHILKTDPLLLESTAYDSLSFKSENGVSHRAVNTNIIARSVPGLIASKTGYTLLANGNLIIVFNAGLMKPIIVAVLDSTQEGRFSDVEKLVNASIQKIGQGK
ncbi:MAG: serine hydrolase [Candidatus Paceibacterota bacterium]|jgi:D-alanyl-D-alanine carboxypeptidase